MWSLSAGRPSPSISFHATESVWAVTSEIKLTGLLYQGPLSKIKNNRAKLSTGERMKQGYKQYLDSVVAFDVCLACEKFMTAQFAIEYSTLVGYNMPSDEKVAGNTRTCLGYRRNISPIRNSCSVYSTRLRKNSQFHFPGRLAPMLLLVRKVYSHCVIEGSCYNPQVFSRNAKMHTRFRTVNNIFIRTVI